MTNIKEKAEKYCIENELIDTSDGYTYADNTGTEAKKAYIVAYKQAILDLEMWYKANQDDIRRYPENRIEEYIKQFE